MRKIHYGHVIRFGRTGRQNQEAAIDGVIRSSTLLTGDRGAKVNDEIILLLNPPVQWFVS